MPQDFFHIKSFSNPKELKRFFILACLIILIYPCFSFTPATISHHETLQQDGDSSKTFKNVIANRTDNPNTGRFALNPLMVPFVEDYLKHYADDLEKMKSWGKPYFTVYEKILSDNGLPVELKYLSVVESSLQSNIVSAAGAVGPWQLMPYEASRFGLKVTNDYNDDRTNYLKSTQAAAKLLKELYSKYADWLLVIAAYNCGAGGVDQAISKSGSKNFYNLQYYLPAETRNHVKKYIATHYYFEGSGGWTTLTASETTEKQLALTLTQPKADSIFANTGTIEISGKYNSNVIINKLLMSTSQFNRLNPLFDKTLAEGKTYAMHLPNDKLDLFKEKKQEILMESVQVLLTGTGGVK